MSPSVPARPRSTPCSPIPFAGTVDPYARLGAAAAGARLRGKQLVYALVRARGSPASPRFEQAVELDLSLLWA